MTQKIKCEIKEGQGLPCRQQLENRHNCFSKSYQVSRPIIQTFQLKQLTYVNLHLKARLNFSRPCNCIVVVSVCLVSSALLLSTQLKSVRKQVSTYYRAIVVFYARMFMSHKFHAHLARKKKQKMPKRHDTLEVKLNS